MHVSINTYLMRFQNRFGVVSRISEGLFFPAHARLRIVQEGVKSVTFHCEYLDGEGECRFYIFCITFCNHTFLIATTFSEDSIYIF
jgi:hypothetical protein